MFQLSPSSRFEPFAGPVVLLILDGVGIAPATEGNAVALARTPVLDRLMSSCPCLPLFAHGTAVGMPSDEDMGNSEVGHNALGAGRIFAQGAKLVAESIEAGRIWKGTAWKDVMKAARSGGTLHFLGLFSDGNVHSHLDHLEAMILRAKDEGAARVRVHVLLDGRDVGETSALDYLDPFETFLEELRGPAFDVAIASGGGRMHLTMDRYDADWSMVERGWNIHVRAQGRRFASAREAVLAFRAEKPGIIDQDLPGFVVERDGQPLGPVTDGDALVFFNFRGDRAIEISKAFTDPNLERFDRGPLPDVVYAGMMQYDGDLRLPERFLVEPPVIDRTLGEHLAAMGVSQWACSETQKYGHVTYFWNGNRSGRFDESTEEWVEISSDRVPFEQRPWMKAAEITDALLATLAQGRHRFLRVNLANGDMVGHTGNLEAAICAMQVVDLQLARVLAGVREVGGVLLVTADHGNADEMLELDKKGAVKRDAQGRPKAKTSHTLNRVPFVLVAPEGSSLSLRDDLERPGLANVAATVLELLGFEPPSGYEPSLLRTH